MNSYSLSLTFYSQFENLKCKAGNGKAAQTSFAVVGYDEETDSTVVLAKPMTG